MIALLTYIHRSFLRSYRYGAPTVIYVGILLLIYSTVPNPIMESYAFTSALLFVVAAAIGSLTIDGETANQEMATLAHARSIVRLGAAKLLYAWIFASALGILAVLYPTLLGRFERMPDLEELVMGVLYHAALAALGVSLSGWFSVKLIYSRFYAILGLCLWVALGLGARGIADALPDGLSGLIHLLPPVSLTMHALTAYGELSMGAKWLPIAAAVGYAFLSTALFLIVLNRKKLDYPGE
ncbi:hypothetical protein B9G55_00710 [Saccharibacillus sp. O16]|nr:hypothetical protein B9G55_00710 [Saccharibacillus sp. O16]